MEISIIIPVYNEEDNINMLYDRLKSVMKRLEVGFEMIFINDGSKDNSMAMIRALSKQHSEVRYIDFSRNFGHQVAVTAGLDKANGDAVVIIDADLQDPPELIIDMYNKMKEGYEVVYAKRKKTKRRKYFQTLDGQGILPDPFKNHIDFYSGRYWRFQDYAS